MQNGNTKIENLFDGYTIFNVPKYQRAYSWDEENLEPFLDDLKNQINSTKDYFLGTLLFHEKSKRKTYKIIDIVDGQQRITTIMIFLKVLIERLQALKSDIIDNEIYEKYVFNGKVYKLELENDDNSFLHDYILGTEKKSTPETPSQKRLLEAKEYFIEELENISQDKLEIIFDKLISSDIILYIVNNIADATQIFELLNDRGRKLTNLESVKSFLMYRVGCLTLDETEQSINDIQGSFASIYRNIEKYNLNEKDILRFHTIAFEESKTDDYNTPEKYIKIKINKLFETSQNHDYIKNEILAYTKRLKKSFEITKELKINSIKLNELDNLVMIGRVNPFYPLIMWIYENKKNELKEFLSNLTKFTFKATLISLRSNGETDFYKWFRKDKDFNINLIKIPIDNNWWNINSRTNENLEYRNFYHWINKNIIKYILFSYENHLRKLKGYPLLTIENYISQESREKFSIEHITAQKSPTFEGSSSFEEKYLHSIGNLVLDTTSSNSRKGNKKGAEKNEEFKMSPFMSQNEIKESNTNWDKLKEIKEFIDNRNTKIINFIKENLL